MIQKSILYTATFFLFFFTACDNNEKIPTGSLVPAKFEFPFNNTTAQIGQTIRVEVSIANLDLVQKIKVFTKDTVIFEGTPSKENYLFEINTSSWNFGTNQLSLETQTVENKTHRDHRIVKLFPNTFPQEYTAE